MYDADDADQDPDDAGHAEGVDADWLRVHHGSAASRSTRSAGSDMPDLPRVAMEDRTIGRTFRPVMAGSTGRRCSSPSPCRRTGRSGTGCRSTPTPTTTGGPRWMRCCSPGWSTGSGTTCARSPGSRCSTSPPSRPQLRMAAHLHAAIRGAIPRRIIKDTVAAVYYSAWWPPIDQVRLRRPGPALGRHRLRRPGHRGGVADLGGGAGPGPGRPGRGADACGPVRHADRHRRDHRPVAGCGPGHPVSDEVPHQVDCRHLHPRRRRRLRPDRAREAHIDRLHDELRYLPCGETCANWLRYGIQPKNPTAGLRPGRCPTKAHDRENLGLGGRRVLVSRQWSGKTLAEHKADRATVVREALEAAGMLAPEIERMAATVTLPTASPGSCGPTPSPIRSPTPRSSWPPSLNGSAGKRSTKPRKSTPPNSRAVDNFPQSTVPPRDRPDHRRRARWQGPHLGLPRMTSRPWS